MKNLITRTISLICAVTLLICALSVCAFAEETPATFTDLPEKEEQAVPEEEQPVPEEEIPEESEQGTSEETEGEPGDGAVESVEILITKNMKLGDSWEGVTRDTRLVVLKLDVDTPQTVHLILEGQNAWASVQKSDRLEDEPKQIPTDGETKLAVISWEAEQGSYLITIGPEVPNMMANVSVMTLDEEAYLAREEAKNEEPEVEDGEETEAEQGEDTVEEIPEEPADKEEEPEGTDPKQEEPTEEDTEEPTDNDLEEGQNNEPGEEETSTEPEEPQERSAYITLSWDTDNPHFGDIAHFELHMTGYENLSYTLQWQTSLDKEVWTDYTGATDPNLDIVLTEENDGVYFRLMIYVEGEDE